MNIKSTLSAMTLGLAVLTGCESLDKSVVLGAGGAAANAAARGDKRAAVAAGATGAAVAATSMTNDSRSESASRKTAVSAQRSSVGDSTGTSSKTETSTVSAPAPKPTETVAEPKNEPKVINVSEMADDEFIATLKKIGKIENSVVYSRAMRIKDEKLLAEFVRMYPSQANNVVDKRYNNVQTSELAEALIDNLKNPRFEPVFGMEPLPDITGMLFSLAGKLDATARAKYLARAKDNREAATKEGVFVLEKFYIGMPVIDYVMISLEDKHEWTKQPKWNSWIHNRADMKTYIGGKDWKVAWKITNLSFDAKSRYKYFKVKGTLDGFFEFVKKYLDKSAKRTDITIDDGGWWQYNDDEHEIKVFLNDNSGYLNVWGM